MDELRVLVAEDHGEMRGKVVALLSAVFQVVAAVANGEQLVQSAAVLRPDVIVSDIAMPVMHGFAAREDLLSIGIACPFVFITGLNPQGLAAEVKDSRVGFVHKADLADELMFAVHAAAAGRSYLSRRFREGRI